MTVTNGTPKLVRDRIPEIIKESGKTPRIEILDEGRFMTSLLEKVVEEAEELRVAKLEQVAEEIADVLEVLLAVAESHRLEWTAIEETRRKKHELRGGFSQRIFLLGTE